MMDLLDVHADSGILYNVNPDQIQRIYRVGETTVVTLADGSSINTPEYNTSLVRRIRELTKLHVRYIVRDLDAAIQFYVKNLGFKVDQQPALSIAMLSRGDVRLMLNGPGSIGGSGQAMSDGTAPGLGGSYRFGIQVDDIESVVARLRQAGVAFRGNIVAGAGDKHVLLNDPSGNPVELFEP